MTRVIVWIYGREWPGRPGEVLLYGMHMEGGTWRQRRAACVDFLEKVPLEALPRA